MSDPLVRYDEIREELRSHVEWWIDAMGIRWWTLEVSYIYETGRSHGNGYEGAARADVRWEYKHASIEFYIPTIAKLEDRDLEPIVVHELVHVLVAPMQDGPAGKLEEFSVSLLTDAFLWTKRHASESE